MMLDEKLTQELKDIYKQLNSKGEILSQSQLDGYYEIFRKRFGPDKLKGLDGEELLKTIHEHGNQDSLVYWLEFKDDDEFPANFGSIAGGSALKFGIYRRRETGTWMTGSPKAQTEITLDQAIECARKHRDDLIKGAELLEQLPQNGTDEEYRKLQEDMDRLASSISDTAWGHKYLSLLYPDKLDDYHNAEYQRFHLIKLLQVPPKGEGRYIVAGCYIAIARELDMPINNLTTITNFRHGRPHRYWRIGTSDRTSHRNHWPEMRDGNYVAIGWTKLGDLSEMERNEESKERIRGLLKEHYPNTSQAVGRAANQIFNFVAVVGERDVILAADGSKIIGLGRVAGGYRYDGSREFCHIRPVEWYSFEEWELPVAEGIQTTLHPIRKDNISNLIEIERRIQHAPPLLTPAHTPIQLEGFLGRIQSVLERKGQVIIYGPPGTGKTYWAERAARDLAALSRYKRPFASLDDEQRATIAGAGDKNGCVRMCCFHPAYGYEDFLEGYRPESANGNLIFNLREGIFKEICKDASANLEFNYYLIIDEINRGDIPRIFGELLTVLEKDKRGKSIILPISGKLFQVPRNVYIIGTMNTADRSIALLDTALRRRFSFIELMPDISILGNAIIEGIPLGPWLEALNKRICEHVGRDARNLQIGHSYLMEGGRPINNFQRFAKALREDIIPLLEEYCYEDYKTLEKILGKGLVDIDSQQIHQELFDESRHEELVQALLAPSPEISTSSQAQVASEQSLDIESEDEEGETTPEGNR